MITLETDIEKIKKIVFETNLKHVAFIMDGNRRYAKKHFLPTAMGHKKGVDSLKSVIRASKDFGIKYVTCYAFSTENWKRTEDEVNFLMHLLAQTIKSNCLELDENGVKITFIGHLERLDKNLLHVLQDVEDKTKNNSCLNLQIAFNYGARDEIVHAVKKIVADAIEPDMINEDTISNYLYTANLPDPDLLIRTGGEKRLSNFLLWQFAYGEFYVTDKFWPEFDTDEYLKAIFDFKNRKRRFGK